jgi:hypothetical protein
MKLAKSHIQVQKLTFSFFIHFSPLNLLLNEQTHPWVISLGTTS